MEEKYWKLRVKMMNIIRKLRKIMFKSGRIISENGFKQFFKISISYLKRKMLKKKSTNNISLDILFVNGTTLPHPERYRVDHQIEQLSSNGLTANKIYYEDLTLDMIKYYRGFVFFRVPITPEIDNFIDLAKKRNKTCFFDIDDLVIDTSYTNNISYVSKMPSSEKKQYDDGVLRTKQTLSKCEFGITTTERLQKELSDYGLRDVFINRNVASDEMIQLSLETVDNIKKDSSKIILGYFSGSITHNEDFELIISSVVKIMEKYDNVFLKIVGFLDLPKELKKFENRIIRIHFMDWKKMPQEIATCDINLAPLRDSIFNEAKSENKWLEASLVKVVTIASNFGAFKSEIIDGKTGILVENREWCEKLDYLILNPDIRMNIAENAFLECLNNRTTISTGNSIAEYIMEHLRPNVAFVLPSTDISGGVNVVLKHADILIKYGYDVSLINLVSPELIKYTRDVSNDYNVLHPYKEQILTFFDNLVGTLWSTLPGFIDSYPNKLLSSYFVQNFETGFMKYGDKGRIVANSTYASLKNIHYTTMSLWCKNWLKEKFGKEAWYASNGIDIENFQYKKRNFKNRKIRILVEGDSQDHYKNVDEAFRIIKNLDFNYYEISYLSYRNKPKNWYHVDHFYNRVSPNKVGEIYAENDILIKSSLLESFSYPPLEMMATGGVSIVVPNDGNAEYLVDKENCLLYSAGNIEMALELIEELSTNKELYDKLSINGRSTAESYIWENKESDILKLYPISNKKKQKFLIAPSVSNSFEDLNDF